MKRQVFLPLLVTGLLTGSLYAFDLSGTWHVSSLDLPGGLVQNKDSQGVLLGLNGGRFDIGDGTLTISPTGAVSGLVGQTVSGTASVSPDGTVTLALTSPEAMTLTLPITTGSDLMATAHGAPDFHELLVMAKAPSNAVQADLEGSWWVMELDVPADIGLHYDNNGHVVGVDNTNSFRQSRGQLVVDHAGRYSYNSGQEVGAVSVNANGQMTLVPDDASNPTIQFHLNALKDVMITAKAENDGRELIVLVKSHEVRSWEAAGHWTLASENLPGSLPVSYDGTGHVTNISQLDSFQHRNGVIDFSLDGTLSGHLESGFQGSTASTTNGILPIYHGEPAPFSAAVNASGDFFVGVGKGTQDLEMLMGVRSVRPLVVGMVSGGPPKVVWVPAAGRVLQESATASNWQNVAGSETTSSYTPNLATDGAQHFYRLVVP